MGKRTDLHAILVSLLGSDNVYFQPPETVRMQYPCIVYQRDANDVRYADDKIYAFTHCYTIYVIDPNPDTEIPDRMMTLPMCRMERCYTADNLNHYVFNLYY